MPAVLALADVGADESETFGRPERAHALHELGLGKVRVRVADRCEQLVFGITIPVDKLNRRRMLDRRATEQRLDEFGGAFAGGGEIVRPSAAAVGNVDPAQKARNDLAQFVQHQVGVLPGLGQWMGTHPQQQSLEGLAAAVDADVGK